MYNGLIYYREGMILGLGNPLLDISASVDLDFLKKYNLKANDAILAENIHKPLYDELIEQYNADFIAGGAVQNTLRVAQVNKLIYQCYRREKKFSFNSIITETFYKVVIKNDTA